MIRQIKSGEGWRLGWNPSAAEFCGLVGGEGWAIELTTAEFLDFGRSVSQLAIAMAAMNDSLMDEERLCCEHEIALIWLEAEGFPAQYGLRFILLNGRKAEGEWPPKVVQALLIALAEPPFTALFAESA